MDWLFELENALPPPPAETRGAVPTDADWALVEAALGVAVPTDFKRFLAAYGSDGMVGGQLFFFSPVSRFKPPRLPGATQRAAWAYAELSQVSPARFPLPAFPATGSFFPIGATENGDRFGWIIAEEPPDAWKTAWLWDEDGEPQVYDVPFGPFLLGVVTGRIALDGLAEAAPWAFL